MSRYEDWMAEAKAELAAARTLFGGSHYSWCCLTAQQAAEKALKAGLERRASPRFGHNLNDLLGALAGPSVVPQPLSDAVARLNRHYIATRYPDAFPAGVPAEQYTSSDAAQALEDADAVVGFVERAR
ncbi:MAG: HEPN domain-containing protein [Deltaproteobacteria bacterium]|nr:HEPN domain-containing protein [Deltaproteobacteria bacterium]